MSTPHRIEFERLRYWQGQMLRAADDRDQRRLDAYRRRLHNLALHSTEGVAFGLHVAPLDEDPMTCEVACGLGYDCRGRELLLQRPRRIAMPAQAAWLVLRPRETAGRSSGTSPCCAVPEPGCISEEALLLDADFELAWAVGENEPVQGVALARVDAAGALDKQFRPRQARPLARPRLARGETLRGDTPWEPWTTQEADGRGGLRDWVLGVQTRIDTSAAGFTSTPCYVATLQSQGWDLAKAEFPPAFFPHVADATPDGFTFRLLMTEIARRRYEAVADASRVAKTTRGPRDRLQVKVASAAAFRPGDVVAQLRPRADKVVRVLKKCLQATLTLEAELSGVEPGSELAVGNLPRISEVVEVKPANAVLLLSLTATPALRKGDVLVRIADRRFAVIDRIVHGKCLVGDPFEHWQAADPLAAARRAASVEVKTAALTDDGLRTSIELPPGSEAPAVGTVLVLLNGDKHPLAIAQVVARDNAVMQAEPPLPAAQLAELKRFSPVDTPVTVEGVEPYGRSILVMKSVGPFAKGDFVAVVGQPAQMAFVEDVDAQNRWLKLASPLDRVQKGDFVVAANWRCATTVSEVPEAPQGRVVVGRSGAARPGDFVVPRSGDAPPVPVPVIDVQDAALTLAASIAGLQRLDTLAIGRFLGVADVVRQEPRPEEVVVAQPGRLEAGDCVVLLADGDGGAVDPDARVVQVLKVDGAKVLFSESPGSLRPGRQLACVHWRDSVSVKSVGAAGSKKVEVDRSIPVRENDVVGLRSCHVDHSNPGVVENIEGDTLTLALSDSGSGIAPGDGIVAQDWVDGGIVGPAAVSYLPGAPPSIPLQWQPYVRMKTSDGLERGASAMVHGFDLLSGRYVSSDVDLSLVDPALGRISVRPKDETSAFRLRPETLSLITSFNAEFPRAFALFSQKQQLSVRWTGCAREFTPDPGCPGQQPGGPCQQNGSSED